MKNAKKHRKNKRYSKAKWHEPTGYNVHHRLPKSRGGSNDQSNFSRVPIKCHNAFNLLFGSNPTAHEVALVLTNIWIDPAYEIIVRLKGDCDENNAQNVVSASV